MWIIVFAYSDFPKISTNINNTDFFCFISQIIKQYQYFVICDYFRQILIKYSDKRQFLIAFYFHLILSTCKHFFLRIPAKFLIWKLNFNLFFTVYFHVKYGFISMCKNIIGRHVCLFDFYIRPCIRCYTKSQCTIQI